MNNVTSRSFYLPAVALLIAASLIPSPAQADCTAPAAVEGTIEYFSAQKIFKYCDGTSWNFLGNGGGTALSGITAATGANSINNADYAQTLNWQLTTNDKDAFTFTENTASTATGHSSLLKASTLATSTATPLMVTNLGNAPSFRVNDATDDADTTPFVIDASGNVGIGTASPASKLHVYDTSGAGTYRATSTIETNGEGALSIVNADNTSAWLNPEIWLKRARGTLAAPAIVQNGDSLGAIHAYGYDGVDYDIWGAGIEFTVDGTPGVNDMPTKIDFITVPDGSATAVERMTIKNNGNLGIGMTAPIAKLHIGTTTGDDGLTIQQAAANSGNVNFRRSNGTLTVPTAVVNNDEIGEMQFNAYNNGAFQIAALLQAVVDGAPGVTNVPGRFIFYTATGGGGIVERMRLTSGGNLGIGTALPGADLSVYGGAVQNYSEIEIGGDAVGKTHAFLGTSADTNGYFSIQSIKAEGSLWGDISLNRSGGNVGIGTAAPATKLHVAGGSVRFDTGAYGLEFNGAANNGIKTLASSNNLDMYALGNLKFYNDTDNTNIGTEGTFFYGGAAAGTTPTPLMVLLNGGNVGIGTTSPQSTLHVPDGKYAQFEDNNAGAPPAGDCDNNAERGRMSIDTTNNLLYVCNGATRGWDYLTLTN